MAIQHKIVVTRHRPWLRMGLVAGVTIVLVVGAVAIFNVSRSLTVSNYAQTKSELQTATDQRRQLARDLRESRAETKELREQVAYLERTREIDAQASAQVRGSLAELEAEVAELREQIAFYQVIVSPQESRLGLRVLEAHLRPSAQPDLWTLELVLIQSAQRDKPATGGIDVTVTGFLNGKEQTLELEQLLLPDQRLDAFEFRYFQELSAGLKLPPGYNPKRLTVTLRPDGAGSNRVVEEYEWAGLVRIEPALGSAEATIPQEDP